MKLKDVIELLVKGIVQDEDAVAVEEIKGEILHGKQTFHYKIKVKSEEISLLVGKNGMTIKSLRTLMSKLAGKQKLMAFIDIDESDKNG